jgi:prolyl oligopeptidase
MWRACRLVVDTGLHYLGWTRQRAIDFMAANTALSLHNIEAEVDRYISWPGQALAYKTGELKIRSLRQRAEEQLGASFNLREFHEVVLRDGAVPLNVLEANVNDYIKSHAKGGHVTKFEYPKSRKSDQIDDLHGTKVADPYRWLEEYSPETQSWIEAQNKITFAHLEKIPQREKLRKRLTDLWNFERFGIPTVRRQRYFYERNDGLQNQNVVYVADGLNAQPRILLDPNSLSKDGTVALSGSELTDDGEQLAYAISTAGSDWKEWKVRDVDSAKDTPDHVRWAKFSGASWTPDGKGFYYSRYDEPKEGEKLTGSNYFQKLFYHRLGTPQSEDKLIHHRPDRKELGFVGNVTDDGKYLAIHVWLGSSRKNGVSFKDLSQTDSKVVDLLTDFENEYAVLGNDGPVFFFRTDSGAERGRVIAIDTNKPAREHWRDIVPQAADTLEEASIVGDQLFCIYMKHARHVVRIYDLGGKPIRTLDLPGEGTVDGFHGRRGDRETFYSFTNYTTPTSIYHYDLASGKSTVFRRPKVDFKSEDYETKQVFVTSKDGTRVPLSLSYKKGLKLDGKNPTILYGYGGFNISILPAFSVTSAVWMEQGGVWAVANLRGGGEYGRPWHEAGMLDRKQNVFDDFQACGQWLIDNRYTSRERLAIQGGSNGGLLVGACMTQRPDLFGVCLPAVGVMDMLRFHKFTIGWAWVPEYGSADDAQQFKTLIKYSPLHNLKPGTKYPATLITTADHDDRVVPAHSFKYAAALQAAHAGDAPILIRIETKAGHGAGKPTSKRIEEAADILGFALDRMGLKK